MGRRRRASLRKEPHGYYEAPDPTGGRGPGLRCKEGSASFRHDVPLRDPVNLAKLVGALLGDSEDLGHVHPCRSCAA